MTLAATNAPTTLTPEQVRDYRKKGYLLLRRVFRADEVAAMQAESDRLLAMDGVVHPDNLRTRARAVNGERVTERFDPVVDISPLFNAVTRDGRIVGALRGLYADDMLLFKDKLIFKLPGMSGYAIHQDYSWWQPFPKDIVSVMIAIDGADRSNGCLEVFPGHHDRLLSTPGETRNMTAEEAKQVDLSTGEMIETGPGDVTIFDCLTPHQSGPNTSDRSRRQLYLSYCSARNGDLYARQARHYDAYNRAKMSEDEKNRLFFR